MENKRFLWIVLGIVVIILVAGAFLLMSPNRQRQTGQTTSSSSSSSVNTTSKKTTSSGSKNVSWSYGDSGWKSQGTPPTCEEPLIQSLPSDISKATHILSPGQERTGGYKPHGGFRFDNNTSNEQQVVVPQDAKVVEASRYIEIGEVQYMFDLQTDCGIRFRFDHLATLSPDFQAIADTLPPAEENDSRTTKMEPPVAVKKGDVMATEVGFKNFHGGRNVSFDFGVYDLRQKNQAAQNAGWVAKHQNELSHAGYAICWFDAFSESNNAVVQQVLANDKDSDRTSDYCK